MSEHPAERFPHRREHDVSLELRGGLQTYLRPLATWSRAKTEHPHARKPIVDTSPASRASDVAGFPCVGPTCSAVMGEVVQPCDGGELRTLRVGRGQAAAAQASEGLKVTFLVATTHTTRASLLARATVALLWLVRAFTARAHC